jgi:hypothetical protein
MNPPPSKERTMTDGIIDLSKPTGCFEVSVWHYKDDRYSVDTDRGHGRLTVYETDSQDKALGVAEYIEMTRRLECDDSGEIITNEGTPFDGTIVHWDCEGQHA